MKKKKNPGDMYNAFQKKRGVPSGDGRTLRSADAVVESEQNASHQFGKGKKKAKKAKKKK